MKLLDVDILWNLIWIVPVFFAVAAYAFFRRKKILGLIFADKETAKKYVSLSPQKRVFRVLCLFLSILSAMIAAAGLTWGREAIPEGAAGHDLMILFDVSKSMLSDDVAPSRLAHGKWLVRELVKANTADRFGLIAFAGTSFLQCPLTTDKTSFLQMTDSLDTDTIAYGGTNLQSALENAIRAFEGAEGKHKAVILITDGDELTGNAESVTKQLADAEIPLFIAGIGNPENPTVIRIKDKDGKTKILTDQQGNAVKSPLNESTLAELARKTSGIYVRSTAQDSGFEMIENGISKLDLRTKDKMGLTGLRPIEHPVYPLGATLLFLCLYFLTGESGKIVHKAGLLAAAMLFSFSLSAQDTEKPLSAAEHFNKGVDAQSNNQPDVAIREYEQAIAAEQNTEVRSKSYLNLGAIVHGNARKKFAEAQDALKQQNVEDAEKTLDESLRELDKAEALYRENMKRSGDQDSAIRNQQILLKDRVSAEELKKEIEELKRLQEEAKKQAQEAMDRQKKQRSEKDQQKKQEQQKQAQDAAAQAQKKVQELKEQAQKMEQKQMSQQTEQAEKELQQAQGEQKKENDEKAEEHLEKALQILSQNEKKDKEKKDGSGKEDQQEKDQQNGEDKKQPEPTPKAKPLSPGEQKKKMEQEQAEAVLEQMSKDEKEWRDLIKGMQRKNAPSQKPQKDW